jgi:hypothetical protein
MAEPPDPSDPPKPGSPDPPARDNRGFSEDLSKEFELAPNASLRSIDAQGRVERLPDGVDAPSLALQPSSAVSLLELPEGEEKLELVERVRARPATREGPGALTISAKKGGAPPRGIIIGVGSLLALLLIALSVGWYRTRRPQLALTTGYAVSVDSEPAGAEIIVDGRTTGQKTPATLPSWDWVMPHEIALKLPGHATFRQLIAEGPHPTTLKVVLGLVAFLDLQSTPPGAEVRRGDFKIGTTPGQFELAAATKETLSLHLVGYLPVSLELTASPGEAVTRAVVLVPSGTLTLDSDPLGVQVEIDDHAVGETPLQIDLEANRPHRLRLSAPGLTPEQRKVVLSQGKNTAVSVLLGDAMDRELRGMLSKTDRRLRVVQQEMRRLDDPRQSREFFQTMARNRRRGRLEAEIDALEARVERLQADIDSHRSAIEDRLEKKEPSQ